jgi:glycosyltransferase involved in cell wall biosynthesis
LGGDDVPRVSVIIPTFNRARRLPRAVQSVAGQTFTDCEVCIVNDGGEWPDDLALPLCGPPVRVVQRSRGGPAAARNTGLASTDSEIVAYLDDDDEWRPDHLATVCRVLEDERKCLTAYTVAEVVDRNVHVRWWGDCRFDKFIADGFYTIFPLSCTAHRRELVRRCGPFDENPLLIGPEDCEFAIRASDLSPPTPMRRRTVVMHRDESMTRYPRQRWADTLEYVIEKLGYGRSRRNWLMFYRAFAAAVEEGKDEQARRWAKELDRELPYGATRIGTSINGTINLPAPVGLKAYCRRALED